MATISNVSQFSPTQVSGCSLWLDAADAATITLTGSNITNVRDKSGQNVVLSNATGFTYSNLFNGSFPSFYNPNGGRSGTNTTARLGVNALFGVTVPFTIFFAGIETATSGNYGYVCDSAPGGVNRQYILTSNLESRFGTGSGISPVKVPFQACAQYYISGGAMIVNGTTYYTQTVGLSAFTTGGVTIGNRYTLDESWPGHLCEIIIYNKPVPTSERQQIEGYLAWKWNLQASLPTTHPFYTNPFVRSVPITPIANPFAERTNYSLVPTQISGCALWLDAADANSITQTNGSVSVWKDKSGNTGRDATAVSNPKLSAINGVQAMNMTTASYFTGAVSITTTTLTCFAVANTTRPLPNVAGSDQRLVSLANTTNVDFGRVDGTIALFNQASSSGIAVWRTPGLIGLTPITTNNPFMAVSQYTGTNGFIWGNGTAGSTTGTASSGSFAITKYGIGNQANPTAEYWVGTIGEVIIYNIALTTSQRQQVEGYLAWKWGLQANLPSTHPFFRNPFIANLSITTPIANVYRITNKSFSPPPFPGMALWLDAADSATVIRTGSSVTRWDDKSGNGYNASSNSNYAGTTLPTYSSNTTNKYVQMTNTQALCTATYNYTTAWSCFVCMNSVSIGSRWLISPYVTVNNVLMGMNQGNNKIYNTGFNTVPADIAGNHIEYTSAENTNALSNLLWYRDGVIQASNVKNLAVPANASAKMGIGANATFSDAMAGTYQIYEVIIYNTYLSVAQRQQTEGYLAWKWGLQKSLPTNHPFYLFPPG